MQLRNHRDRLELGQIGDGRQQQRRIFVEVPDPMVALPAQQPADLASPMIVVNNKAVRTFISAVRNLLADRAAALLDRHHTFIFGNRYTIAMHQVVVLCDSLRFNILVSYRLLLFHVHHWKPGFLHALRSSFEIVLAKRKMLAHFFRIEWMPAEFARTKTPSSWPMACHAQLFSDGMMKIYGPPRYGPLRMARFARIVYAVFPGALVRKFKLELYRIAHRAYMFVAGNWGHLKAGILQVPLKPFGLNVRRTPWASDGGAHELISSFGTLDSKIKRRIAADIDVCQALAICSSFSRTFGSIRSATNSVFGVVSGRIVSIGHVTTSGIRCQGDFYEKGGWLSIPMAA